MSRGHKLFSPVIASLIILVTLLCARPAAAHKSSDSYLVLTQVEKGLEGHWDIALRDLALIVNLDPNEDRNITWGEVRQSLPVIRTLAKETLQIKQGSSICTFEEGNELIDRHSDGAYLVLKLKCPEPTSREVLKIRYSFLFDIDAQHRSVVKFNGPKGTQLVVIGPDKPEIDLDPAGGGEPGLGTFFKDGVWHIWIGVDHLLFLLVLLLGALSAKEGVLMQILKVVTSFTVAHSITLALAVFQIVHPPVRLIESLIALSIAAIALNNLTRWYPQKEGWKAAFLFGLVHGFGFASVLQDLNLDREQLFLALAGFNLGVEAGQIALVLPVVGMLSSMKDQPWYHKALSPALSAMSLIAASVWFAERAFNMRIVS